MTKKFKQVCTCTKCGNESEMEVTCSLAEVDVAKKKKTEPPGNAGAGAEEVRVKGTAVCTHCGNEADMWVNL